MRGSRYKEPLVKLGLWSPRDAAGLRVQAGGVQDSWQSSRYRAERKYQEG